MQYISYFPSLLFSIELLFSIHFQFKSSVELCRNIHSNALCICNRFIVVYDCCGSDRGSTPHNSQW